VFGEQDDVLEEVHRVCTARVAALPEHARHRGARGWVRSGGAKTPSPGGEAPPTSPPGERCSGAEATESLATRTQPPDQHLSPGGEVESRASRDSGERVAPPESST
jgi:hypothetical protein